MIQSNEIRLGNYFKATNSNLRGNYVKVFAVSSFGVVIDEINVDKVLFWLPIENLKPIPLTPEILEKCGFETDEPFEDSTLIMSNGIMIIDYDSLQPTDAGFPIAKLEIKYLHQLQNLYFALTGKELDVKL